MIENLVWKVMSITIFFLMLNFSLDFINRVGNPECANPDSHNSFYSPDYDSGWVAMVQSQERTFTYNLGGDTDTYVIDVIAKTTAGSGVNQVAFGTRVVGGSYQGYYWRNLSPSIIKVYRNAHDTTAEQIRVRIWKIE